jgi:hypothetical protein
MRRVPKRWSGTGLAHISAMVVLTGGPGATIVDASDSCVPHWDSVIGQPGMDNSVLALIEYGGELIVGGLFATAGGETVNHLARWSDSSWQPIVTGGQAGVGGDNAWVFALAEYNGYLIVGGRFATAGGQTVSNIARWDGTNWHPLDSGGQIGVDDRVNALAVHNGDLIVGGWFTTAGGQTVNRIARWDGDEWHPLESANGQIGVSATVRALAPLDDTLIAGGDFTTAAGEPANRIAAWHVPQPAAPGDLNCDDVIDGANLLTLLSQWGKCADPIDCPADLDDNGIVDGADLLILLSNWG